MYVDITPGNKTNSCMGMNLNFLKSGSSYAITHIYLLIIFTEIFYKCIIIFFPWKSFKDLHIGYEQRCRRKGPNWTKQSFRRWIHILFRLRRNKEFRFREWVNEKFRLYICTSSSPCGYKLKKKWFSPSTNCKRIVVFWPITPLFLRECFIFGLIFKK